ncbi:MAG: 3-oxoacyl-[acyl-carrier-protein] synthase II [Sphingobacteriales bacterium]|jgi:3-oxoacyl-[acyl-carrier-protein] synthase II
MILRRVVVTGIGAITPIGNSVKEFWGGLLSGKSGAAPITKFDAKDFKTTFACEIKNFDVHEYLDRKEARKLDPFVHFALASVQEAWEDAGLNPDNYDPDRSGVIWGSGIGGLRTFTDEVTGFVKNNNVPRFNPFFIPKMIVDIAAGHISIKYNLRGPNFATVSACASSTHALIDAFNYIRLGKADIFISGGSEASVNEAAMGGFNAMHALSTRNDSPETASRPFDAERDGFVLGEGAGALILEEYEHAVKRGAKIYGEMVGGGMSADAHHITAPHPDGLGAMNVMKNAMEDAELTIADIDYINVHGTSTPLGDISETKAISKLFGEDAFRLNISSTKSMTGHLLGAAGAVEAIATLLAVKNDIIPPTINHKVDDPNIDPRLKLTFNKSEKRIVRAGLCNTFGFGGHNASVIFKKFED